MRKRILKKNELIMHIVAFSCATFFLIISPVSSALSLKLSLINSILNVCSSIYLIYYLKVNLANIPKSTRDNKFFTASMIASLIPWFAISSFSQNTGILWLETSKLFYFFSLFKVFERIRTISLFYKVEYLSFAVITFVNMITCGWIIIEQPVAATKASLYNMSLYWTVSTITTIGYGDITPVTDLGRNYAVIVMIMGLGLYGLVIGNVSKFLYHHDKKKLKGMKIKQTLDDVDYVLSSLNVPSEVHKEAINYLEFKHGSEKLSEAELKVLSNLPEELQHKIYNYVQIDKLKEFKVFKDLKKNELFEVSKIIKTDFKSPLEKIKDKNVLCFLVHGIIEENSGLEKNNFHKKGKYFLLEKSHTYCTLSYCEIFYLNLTDLDENIKEILSRVNLIPKEEESSIHLVEVV